MPGRRLTEPRYVGLCDCGCGQPLYVRWAGQRPRFIKNHSRRRSDEERFWVQVDKTTTCWLWTGALTERGYGQMHLRRDTGQHYQSVQAHRYAYELLVAPIPVDKVVHHACRVRHCVNPDHLRVITQAENIQEARQYGKLIWHEYDDMAPAWSPTWVAVNTIATVIGACTGVSAIVIAIVALLKS